MFRQLALTNFFLHWSAVSYQTSLTGVNDNGKVFILANVGAEMRTNKKTMHSGQQVFVPIDFRRIIFLDCQLWGILFFCGTSIDSVSSKVKGKAGKASYIPDYTETGSLPFI